jgi:probable F420-dependent oxidoreductase
MAKQHLFRFGVNAIGSASGPEWRATARKVEDLGYSVLTVQDHLWTQLAPLTSLITAAEITSKLRLGSLVFGNDFRHPVILAREAATIDLLSDGRLELGIGTGYAHDDYESTGVPFDPAGIRVSRFEEAVQIIKGLFGDEPVTFQGNYYNITSLNAIPKPIQKPHPPILIGGGSPRMLSIAAREADIVSVNAKTGKEGDIDLRSITAQATDQKIEWIRQAAGEKFDALELNTLMLAIIITNDRQAAAEKIANDWKLDMEKISIPELLESPTLLIGSEAEMIEELQRRRERYGISYYSIFGEQYIDTFAPIVARLDGK